VRGEGIWFFLRGGLLYFCLFEMRYGSSRGVLVCVILCIQKDNLLGVVNSQSIIIYGVYTENTPSQQKLNFLENILHLITT